MSCLYIIKRAALTATVQAAGHIVDFALQSGKPFAIVPCCVYHRQFPNRYALNPVVQFKVLLFVLGNCRTVSR